MALYDRPFETNAEDRFMNENSCPCGQVILADTEDWGVPLCYDCYLDLGKEYTKLLAANEVMDQALDDCAWGTSHEECCSRRPFGRAENCDCHISIARKALDEVKKILGES